MKSRICVVPKVSGIGGMVSFLHKFSDGAAEKGLEITNDLADKPYSAILVIGGTKNLIQLGLARMKGVRIVQRLDGINWIHKVIPTGYKHALRANYGNFILAIIRRFIANRIVYQSEFSKTWWEKKYGKLNKPDFIVHNGVDTVIYSPEKNRIRSKTNRILVVEGSMGGGYESGLLNAIELCDGLAKNGRDVELQVVGEVEESIRLGWQNQAAFRILWMGAVSRAEIPSLMAQSDLFFSADIHPACPNAVIEALACGLPVVAFDTGSLKELVPDDCGRVVAYGADSWKLEKPDIKALVSAAEEVLNEQERFSQNARKWAEKNLRLDLMVEKYLTALLDENV
ncbi:MAG TPA: glycosyltransferase family 4 protein [Anaerolineales bacterium]|nr:glycosyltransferase family 4 protein [Anaerolineales bacterium]